MYFLTFTIVDWVDIFSRKVYRDIVIESLAYCIKAKELKLYAYVIMTNHVHVIVSSGNGKLSDTVRDFKKYTANAILDAYLQKMKAGANGCCTVLNGMLNNMHAIVNTRYGHMKTTPYLYKAMISFSRKEIIYI